MIYNFRDDIVLEKIGGINVLVALRSAWKDCPFAIQISPSSASFFRKIHEGKDSDIIIREVSLERNLALERTERFFYNFIRFAEKNNYLCNCSDVGEL